MALNLYTDANLQEQQLASFCKTILGMANNFTHLNKYSLAQGHPHIDLTFKTQPLPGQALTDSMLLQAYEQESSTLKIELSMSPKLCSSKNASSYVIAAIQEAVDAAADFFAEQNIQFKKEDFHHLVNTVSSCRKTQLH